MDRPPLSVDADITRASTISSRVYHDPEIYRAQRDRIFASSWQFICDDSHVKVPGQIYPFTLLEGCLDEPLLLTRDFDDRLHCLSNVCTHRGNIVVEGSGAAGMRHLRCRYHGRRFGLDGCFQHMPEFEEARDFPSQRDNLPHVPLANLGPLLFASLKPHASFEDLVAPMRARLDWLPLHQFRFDPARSRDYLVQCNWGLYVENYLEGFHIPYVHAGLNQALDYGCYRIELFDRSILQLGIASAGEHAFDLPSSSPDHGQSIAAYYWWLWPNTMFNFYPWGLSINVVRPLAVDRTRVSFLSYVWDESRLERGAGAGLDRVEREDEAIVEAVQRGVRSRFYESGRYSPTREQGVHHFHRMLAAALRGEES
jgi:choline monooxygenase